MKMFKSEFLQIDLDAMFFEPRKYLICSKNLSILFEGDIENILKREKRK